MKKIIISILLLSSSVFAANSAIYCKSNGKIYNAASKEGHVECNESFGFGHVCFTGDRDEVISMINNRQFDWDEEWLKNAHYIGENQISYMYVDGPNNFMDKKIISRCDKD